MPQPRRPILARTHVSLEGLRIRIYDYDWMVEVRCRRVSAHDDGTRACVTLFLFLEAGFGVSIIGSYRIPGRRERLRILALRGVFVMRHGCIDYERYIVHVGQEAKTPSRGYDAETKLDQLQIARGFRFSKCMIRQGILWYSSGGYRKGLDCSPVRHDTHNATWTSNLDELVLSTLALDKGAYPGLLGRTIPFRANSTRHS